MVPDLRIEYWAYLCMVFSALINWITTTQMDASSWPRRLLGMDQGSLANDQATGDSLPNGDAVFLFASMYHEDKT